MKDVNRLSKGNRVHEPSRSRTRQSAHACIIVRPSGSRCARRAALMAFSDWGAISALRGWEHVAARDQSASLVPLLPRAGQKGTSGYCPKGQQPLRPCRLDLKRERRAPDVEIFGYSPLRVEKLVRLVLGFSRANPRVAQGSHGSNMWGYRSHSAGRYSQICTRLVLGWNGRSTTGKYEETSVNTGFS